MPRKRTYRIAVAQLRVSPDDMELNACGILDAIDLAAKEGADFLVTPEMALTGYHDRFDKARRNQLVKLVREAAAAGKVTVMLGCGDKRGGKVYNEVLVIGGDGRLIGRHAKIVATNGDRKWSVPGTRLKIFRDRGLTFGCLICNDLWVTPGCGPYPDPRLTLQLANKGARVVFHSIHSGRSKMHTPYHESNVMLRAREGGLYIATANASQPTGVNCATGVMGPDCEWVIRCNRRGRQFAVTNVEITGKKK